MKYNEIISLLKYLGLFCILMGIVNCKKNDDLNYPDSTIVLRFIKSYDNHSIDNAVIGLKWALSYIGAKKIDESGIQISGDLIIVNCEALELSKLAVSKLILLNGKFKSSEYYKSFQSIDLGRFIATIIGASEHYYSFVNQPKKLNDLIKEYSLGEKKGYVNKSGVSYKNRIISFSDQLSLNQLFVAEEVDQNTGELLEYETVDIMENGQLRFGIYNVEGDLINSTNPSVSKAGKPAKCIWCHESKIQTHLLTQDNYPDYLSYEKLLDTLNFFKKNLEDKQSMIYSGVDFSKLQEHTETEMEYISFMEPSILRLSIEWQMSEKKVSKIIKGLPTHQHHEFPFLGTLFNRADVDSLSPYNILQVSSSVREYSKIEVNHLK